MDKEDILVVYIGDHGKRTGVRDRNTGEYKRITEVVLPYGSMCGMELEECLAGINPKFGVIVADICYGGGIAKRLGKGEYIGVSPTTNEGLAYATERDCFGVFFFQAFRNSRESDSNKDGKVTIAEAFDYAKNKHAWAKNGRVQPQLFFEFDITNLSIR